MFLRGKNNSRSDGHQDTGGERNLGALQLDSFRQHNHSLEIDHNAFDTTIQSQDHFHQVLVGIAGVAGGGALTVLTPREETGSTDYNLEAVGMSHTHTHNINLPTWHGTSGEAGGPETAPRNVAVNYYCKVND